MGRFQKCSFTDGTPWINVNPNYKEINAKAALADPDSVFHYYQELIRLRHTLPIIVYGKFQGLLEDSETIYAYKRILDGQVLTVACNLPIRNRTVFFAKIRLPKS